MHKIARRCALAICRRKERRRELSTRNEAADGDWTHRRRNSESATTVKAAPAKSCGSDRFVAAAAQIGLGFAAPRIVWAGGGATNGGASASLKRRCFTARPQPRTSSHELQLSVRAAPWRRARASLGRRRAFNRQTADGESKSWLATAAAPPPSPPPPPPTARSATIVSAVVPADAVVVAAAAEARPTSPASLQSRLQPRGGRTGAYRHVPKRRTDTYRRAYRTGPALKLARYGTVRYGTFENTCLQRRRRLWLKEGSRHGRAAPALNE